MTKINLNVNWIVDVLFMVVFMDISFTVWLLDQYERILSIYNANS